MTTEAVGVVFEYIASIEDVTDRKDSWSNFYATQPPVTSLIVSELPDPSLSLRFAGL